MARKIVGMPILGKESLLNSVFSMVLFRNQEIFMPFKWVFLPIKAHLSFNLHYVEVWEKLPSQNLLCQ